MEEGHYLSSISIKEVKQIFKQTIAPISKYSVWFNVTQDSITLTFNLNLDNNGHIDIPLAITFTRGGNNG